jgi:carbamoyltransferase
MGTEVEVLVVENCFLRKEEQDQAFRHDYRRDFELD